MDLGTRIGIGGLFFSIGIAIVVACFFYEGSKISSPKLKRLKFIGSIFVIFGLALIPLLPKPELPNITFRLLSPQFPVIQINNISGEVAHHVLYQLVVWNTERAEDKNPLPILSREYTFLSAHTTATPEDIFQSVAPSLKKGDHLCGYFVLNCADCANRKDYLIDIFWGETGWFSERTNASMETATPIPVDEVGIKRLCNKIDNFVPENQRILITD